jgi:hypothetical protein
MREARRFNRYLFPGMVFIVLLVLYLFHSATGRPYPQSTVISGVHWRFDTVITYASGSDLWPATWAGDNNVYMTWGDGGGFGGSNKKCRTQFGMAKITNDPPSTLSTTNVYGCTSDGTGCIGKYTLDPACNASYASTIAAYGRDILAVDNTMYSIGNSVLIRGIVVFYSSDLGQTWTSNTWSWAKTTGTFEPTGFVQTGMGHTGQDYVYVIGKKYGDNSHTYLSRYPVPIVRSARFMETLSGFTWFAGTPTSPSWGSWSNAVPIHTDSGGGSGGHMTYIPALGRYILTQDHGGTPGLGEVQKLGIYDSPNPWGPWTTVAYYSNWGGYGTSEGLYYSIIPKWISADGTTFWMSFSGGSRGSVDMDALHLVKGTFTLSGGALPSGGGTGS